VAADDGLAAPAAAAEDEGRNPGDTQAARLGLAFVDPRQQRGVVGGGQGLVGR